MESIQADIINTRRARIVEVGLQDAVPGKIVSCFRPTRRFQSVRSPGMLAFSESAAGLSPSASVTHDLFEFMSDSDLEDVVFTYLQVHGWYVVPSSRRMDTPHYEFVLVHRSTGDRGIVQVKSGGTSISAGDYAGNVITHLFATSGQYGDRIPANVVLVTRDGLEAFMNDHPNLLTGAVMRWRSLVRPPHQDGKLPIVSVGGSAKAGS